MLVSAEFFQKKAYKCLSTQESFFTNQHFYDVDSNFLTFFSERPTSTLVDLEVKLKFNQASIIYFEFDPEASQADSRQARIDLTVHEALSLAFHKLLNLAQIINSSEEKHLNFYSERLKSPLDAQSSTQIDTANSFLSIKLFNRKVDLI
jgi:hypothetical protein